MGLTVAPRVWTHRSTSGTRTGAVLVISAALLVLAGLLAPAALHGGVDGRSIAVPALALAFLAAELSVRHRQVRRHATTMSLSEVPLALGLVVVAPVQLVLARLIGSAVAFALRRQAPVKVAFNLALALTETLAVLALVRVSGTPVLDPAGWFVVPVAVAATAVLGRAFVHVVVMLHDGSVGLQRFLAELPDVVLPAALSATVGLAAGIVLVADPRAWVLLVVVGLLAAVAHRHYAVMADRHEQVKQLYRFTELTSTAGTVDGVLRTALRESLSLLRSERAEVLLLPREGAGLGDAVVKRSLLDGQPEPGQGQLDEHDPLLAEVLRGRTGLALPRGTADPRARAFLDRHGLRDAVLVPLWSEGGIAGLLVVGDRAGAVRSYGDDDRQLAESVATQTGLALAAARLVDRLQHDSQHDRLTGLANRGLLEEWLREASHDVQVLGRNAAVLLVDLDGFKQVNDTLGHARGDELLVRAARQLTDEAGAHGRVARLGGDEFAVLLLDEPPARVLARAEAMSAALSRNVRSGDLQVRVGGSIGVALAPDHGSDGSALLHRADVAMYAAKRSGGGVRCWQADEDVLAGSGA